MLLVKPFTFSILSTSGTGLTNYKYLYFLVSGHSLLYTASSMRPIRTKLTEEGEIHVLFPYYYTKVIKLLYNVLIYNELIV